jgi:adenylate kinase family enzyme
MFFLVTGASGVGKTTVRKLIEAEIAGPQISELCCSSGDFK